MKKKNKKKIIKAGITDIRVKPANRVVFVIDREFALTFNKKN